MVSAIRYLAWMHTFHPRAELDLGRSGAPDYPAAKLLEGASAELDDFEAPARFRQAVADRYELPASEILPTNGASGAIWAAYAAVLGVGDEILVEEPTYEPIFAVAEGLGARVRRFRRPAHRGFELLVEEVLAELGPGTRAVALTNPHNPTALLAKNEILIELARELDRRGVHLVVGEVYRELVAPRTTIRKLAPNVIVASSLTKAFGLGWARAGWLSAPPSILERANDALVHALGMMSPSQAAVGAIALSRIDAIAAELSREQEGKRELVEAFARKHQATLIWSNPPPGSIFGFFRDQRGQDLRTVIEAGLENEGLLVVPGSFFGHEAGFRLGFVEKRQRLSEGLRRLERVLSL